MEPGIDGYNQSKTDELYAIHDSSKDKDISVKPTSNPNSSNPTKPRNSLDKKVYQHSVNQFSNQPTLFIKERNWSKGLTNPIFPNFAAFASFVKAEAEQVDYNVEIAREKKVYEDKVEKAEVKEEKEDISHQLLRGRFESAS